MTSYRQRQYEMRDVRTNSIVSETDETSLGNNIESDFQIIRNEIVDIFLDTSVDNNYIPPNNSNHNAESEEDDCPLSAKDFHENADRLQSMKLPELRSILKYYKESIPFKSAPPIYTAQNMKRIKLLYDFALNGTKQRIIERIAHFFKMDSKIVYIQKVVRGHFVRKSIQLRGPALRNRGICVNQTDFYTMEPLEEIEFDQFFSYSEENPTGNYVYGFDHNSLLEMLKNRPYRLQNPYNRENMTPIIGKIRSLERLNKIIADSQTKKPAVVLKPKKSSVKPKSKNSRTREMPLPPVSPFVDETIPVASSDQTLVPSIYPMSTMLTNIGSEAYNYDISYMINKIRTTRLMPFMDRAQNLFMEIDQLGNYTQVSWFTQLNRRDCMRYYRLLRDIWCFRAQMSNDVKKKICPLWDPFSNYVNDVVRFNILTDDEIRCICLRTMEDIILTGIDREFRVLGTFHVLSALTIVSQQARNSMIWLYESVMY